MTSRRGRGEGAVFQRANGLYVARVELPSRDGKRRRKEISSMSKATVLAKVKEARKDLETHGDIHTGRETVDTWMTYWIDNIAAARVRPTTLATYKSLVRTQILPAIGRVRLSKLTPAHVRAMHQSIQQKASSTYALSAHRVLAKSLKDAVREGRVSRNVTELVDTPRQARTDLAALSLEEAVAFLAWAQRTGNPALLALYGTFLMTGQRRGEVLGLEVDRVTDVLDVSWQLQRVTDITTAPPDYEYRHLTGKMYLTRPKSRAGWRVIPLVEPLRGWLHAHIASMPANDYGLLFATEKGQPIEPSRTSANWPDVLTASGVTTKRVRLHDLRHTSVDLLYAAGVPEDIIQEIVGHSTRTMTRAYKSRGDRARLIAAMESLSGLMSGRAEVGKQQLASHSDL